MTKRGNLAEEDCGPLSDGSEGDYRETGSCSPDADDGGEIAYISKFSDRRSSAEDMRRMVSDSGVRE